MASASNTSIMSIRELIDTAFGDQEANIVNHKLIQTILYLLARQLRILERRVEIDLIPNLDIASSTSLLVTEVKIHAKVPKKIRRRQSTKVIIDGGGKQIDTTSITKPGTKGVLNKRSGVSNISATAREQSDSKHISDKTLLDKPFADKSISDKTTTEKSLNDIYSDKTSSEKTSTDKTYTEKSSTTDKTSSGKTSSGKSYTGKSTSDKTTSDKTTINKTSTEKSTTDRSSDKSSTQKSTTKDSTALPSVRSSQEYHNLLETIEERREKQLRVIHQRADSREVRDKTPTPMASLDTMEMQYEKLLIVERVPTEETKAAAGHYQRDSRGRTPRLSIVTQEEFSELAAIVRNLQARYSPVAGADFPDNIKLMQDLRKGASLTDAMAALQLSARLEGAEKALQKMTSLVADLASRAPGLEKAGKKVQDMEPETEILFDAPGFKSQTTPSRTKPKSPLQQSSKGQGILSTRGVETSILSTESFVASATQSTPQVEVIPPEIATEQEFKIKEDWITAEELENSLQKIYNEFLKTVTSLTARSTTNADNALKIAKRLQVKLDTSLDLEDRMNDLETLVSEYSEQINILDTSLSSQMTNYQEQLTQMQHDLETGLEAMAEALANTGGDTTAVTELNTHFTNLQIDLDTANMRQKELKDNQDTLSMDLQNLWKQIELLRDIKSDREEVADALRDKAGLGALNGLVTLQQFDAVRGDFEKRIGTAYDKFNNQEIVWQKAIDDLLRELNEKADWMHVVSLRDDINKNLEKLGSRMHAMMEIVGEPQAAAVSRRLFRDTACLSCSTPAHMKLEEHGVVPALPAYPISRPPAIGAEAPTKLKEDGDQNLCYPGFPIPHPIDTRTHVCQRYCGGSHTLLPTSLSRVPPGVTINPALRQVTTTVGSDGKIYMTDEGLIKKPCLPCNLPKKITLESSVEEQDPLPVRIMSSDMTSVDYCEKSEAGFQQLDIVSVTPPPPIDDYY